MANIIETREPVNTCNFMQEFDGNQPVLSEAEKMEAAYLFKSGMEDVFLANIDLVKRLDGETFLYPYDFSQLKLIYNLGNNLRLNFTVKSFDTETDDPYELDIFVTKSSEIVGHSRYSLDASLDNVRRFDIGQDPMQTSLKQISLPLCVVFNGAIISPDGVKPIDSEEFERNMEDLKFIWNDEFKKREAESKLGFNDQPVGVAEVKEIIELLKQAKPVSFF